jgi:peptide subunit release factor 1 (eRF1)
MLDLSVEIPMTHPDALLDRLAAFEPTTLPVISLYLNTSPDQHGRAHFEAFLRKEMKAAGRTFPLRSPQRDSFERDSERIATYLHEDLQPSSNGVALFACAGADGLFEVLQLDAPIAAHSLYVADRPHLYPLARLTDQHPPYAALIADTNAARLFVFGRGATLRSDQVSGTKVSRSSVGGWSQMRYQRHIENYHLHHAKELVDALEQVVHEDGVEQIVLAGDEVIIPVLREQLPKHLADRIVDVLRLDITTPEHEILKATTEALREHDGETDVQEVGRLLDQYRARQLAVVGAQATIAALTLGQVDTLLVSASSDAVHDDADAAASTPEAADVRHRDGTPIAEQVVRLARTTGAHISFIEDPALLADVGGVGAMLRYRL